MAKKMQLLDKATQDKIKKQVTEKLAMGRKKILELEKKIRSGEAGEEITAELKRAKEKLQKLKKDYDQYEKKALDYIHKNPKKALLAAAVVGVLAGTIMASMGKKKRKK
jgi:hypothetical protein